MNNESPHVSSNMVMRGFSTRDVTFGAFRMSGVFGMSLLLGWDTTFDMVVEHCAAFLIQMNVQA